MRRVEETATAPDGLVVVDERRRVHEAVHVADDAEPLGRQVAGDGVGHLGSEGGSVPATSGVAAISVANRS